MHTMQQLNPHHSAREAEEWSDLELRNEGLDQVAVCGRWRRLALDVIGVLLDVDGCHWISIIGCCWMSSGVIGCC